jgi:hypothetical protein
VKVVDLSEQQDQERPADASAPCLLNPDGLAAGGGLMSGRAAPRPAQRMFPIVQSLSARAGGPPFFPSPFTLIPSRCLGGEKFQPDFSDSFSTTHIHGILTLSSRVELRSV